MRCDKCRRGAIIFQRYSGLHLCEQHFVQDFEAKAKRAIRTHRWMKSAGHIAVALCAGNGSSALLYFLKMLTAGRRDTVVSAITIDEGIGGYSDPARAVRIAESLGSECLVASFRDEYSVTMDEIAVKKKKASSCSYCRALRRSLLNRIAREHGVTRLAFGFNLDDEAQSVLTSILCGDAGYLLQPPREVPAIVPRISPFMHIPEREVELYAHIHCGGFELKGHCPYADKGLEADVRTALDDYTLRHPSTKYSLVNLGKRLEDLGGAVQGEIRTCERCGEPCSPTCRNCRILGEVLDGAA